MIVVGALMLRSRDYEGDLRKEMTRGMAPGVLGLVPRLWRSQGFFGIGGGFLIAPSLIASAGMPVIEAVGSSLVAVCAFRNTTTVSYAILGLVAWPLGVSFIVGGVAGGKIGCQAARRSSSRKGRLKSLFALLIFLVAGIVIFAGRHGQ